MSKWLDYFEAAVANTRNRGCYQTQGAPDECPDCHSVRTLALVAATRDGADNDDVAEPSANGASYYQCSECRYILAAG